MQQIHDQELWQGLFPHAYSRASIPRAPINKMLSCAGADRLQTGMRGAFGKSYGTVARVSIGQVLISMRCRDAVGEHALEALRRAKYKIAGRQKIYTSRKWGSTKDLKAFRGRP